MRSCCSISSCNVLSVPASAVPVNHTARCACRSTAASVHVTVKHVQLTDAHLFHTNCNTSSHYFLPHKHSDGFWGLSPHSTLQRGGSRLKLKRHFSRSRKVSPTHQTFLIYSQFFVHRRIELCYEPVSNGPDISLRFADATAVTRGRPMGPTAPTTPNRVPFDLARQETLHSSLPPIQQEADQYLSDSIHSSTYRLGWNCLFSWNTFEAEVSHYWENAVTQNDKDALIYIWATLDERLSQVGAAFCSNEGDIRDAFWSLVPPVHNAAATGFHGVPYPSDRHSEIVHLGPYQCNYDYPMIYGIWSTWVPGY
jgi:hypothetical protein